MGRALRVIDPDAIYHAGSRGSNRSPIAWDGADFDSLAGELARASTRYRWRVLAWCLLPNHTHIVLQAPAGGFSDGFRQINGNHARRTNRRYGREAHLFKNRPWTFELATPAHLIGAIAYVLRNPITAGLCERADQWPYGSYRATMGLEVAPAWLDVDGVLDLFGHTPEAARAALSHLVHAGQLVVQLPVSDTN